MQNKDQPLVSVIIPTYNRAQLIGRAIRSVLAQNYSRLEIVVVDDGSSDETDEVVAQIQDDRILYIRLESNLGAAGARNAGVGVARGEFVAFLDSDDEWLLDMVECQLSIFSKYPSIDASFTGFVRCYGRNPEYIAPPSGVDSEPLLLREILRKNFITPQTIMLRRDCFCELGGFDVSLSHREDWDFGVRLLKNKKIKFIDRPLAMVYETPGNLTSMDEAKVVTLELFIAKHHNLLSQNPRVLSQHYYFLGHMLMLRGKRNAGMSNLAKSIRFCPNLKAIAGYIVALGGSGVYRFVRDIFTMI